MFFNNLGCMLCLGLRARRDRAVRRGRGLSRAWARRPPRCTWQATPGRARTVVRDRTGEQIVRGLTREIERGRHSASTGGSRPPRSTSRSSSSTSATTQKPATLLTRLLPTLRELEHSSAPDALVLAARLSARRGDIATARSRLAKPRRSNPTQAAGHSSPSGPRSSRCALEIGERDWPNATSRCSGRRCTPSSAGSTSRAQRC